MIKIKDSWGITIAVVIVITAHIIGAFLLTSYKKSLQPPRNILNNDTNQNHSYNARLLYKTPLLDPINNREVFTGITQLPAQSKSVVPTRRDTYLHSIMLYEDERFVGCFLTDTRELSTPGVHIENIFHISGLDTSCS
ncbi:hypothetical protein KBB08_00030 [Candidatus Gracilibacteria bacterium]|nr:hypothetical protein [Candidatus Gracilibacteria bacterium]